MIATKSWAKPRNLAVEAAVRLETLINDDHLDDYCREVFQSAHSILIKCDLFSQRIVDTDKSTLFKVVH